MVRCGAFYETLSGQAETSRSQSQMADGATGLVLPSTSIRRPWLLRRRSVAEVFKWRRFCKTCSVWQSICGAPQRSSEERIMKIEDILVPIDFSTGSLRALEYALAMVDPGGEVYLLHVIDADFLARVSDEGFCDAETARAQMRRKAEEQLQKIARKFSLVNARLESMVVVGKPFTEILRIAADLRF